MRVPTGPLAALLLAVALGAASPRVLVGGEDPVLEGDAKKKHDAEVAKILAELRGEKNKVNVQHHIERIGGSASRAARDALILYATSLKNHEWGRYAFNALAKIGGAKVIEFLTSKSALRSADSMVQQSAADALATTKDPSAASALLDVIGDTTTKSEVLGAAAKAVAQVAPKDERVAESLIALTKAVKDMTRSYGAEALGHLATDRAVERLVEILDTEKSGIVRVGAARGLGNTKRADVIPQLEQVIQNEKALQVKEAASDAIAKIQRGY